MEQSIGDILNGDEPTEEVVAEAVTETVAPEAETVEATDGPVRDPATGRFAPKGEKQPETEAVATPAPQDEPAHIPVAALKDERSKRQALENELAQLRQQMATQQPVQPQPTAQQAPPDRWEDPEGYDQWLVGQASVAARQEAIEAFNYQRIQSAAAQYKADKPDYGDVIGVFGQMAGLNPGLIGQMQSAPNPAQFAYETAKLQIEINQHGGIEGLVEARLAARQAQALEQVQGQLPQSLPPTISSDRSVGSRSGPAWAGPTSMTDLLK